MFFTFPYYEIFFKYKSSLYKSNVQYISTYEHLKKWRSLQMTELDHCELWCPYQTKFQIN